MQDLENKDVKFDTEDKAYLELNKTEEKPVKVKKKNEWLTWETFDFIIDFFSWDLIEAIFKGIGLLAVALFHILTN